VDRLLGYLTTLAKGGGLTPERLADDAEAILGLSEWAAEHREWALLLELVKTLQACFGIAHRVQELLTLLDRGRSAARALGDRRSEVWALQQLASASASAGDTAAAQRYLREADELQGGAGPGMTRAARTDETLGAGGQGAVAAGGGSNIALWIVALLLAGGLGVLAGYLIGNDGGEVGATTATVPVTVTVGGETVTTSDTVTLPATTEVTTATETTTVTTATTVTTGAG
jgi:hypothetical protein